MCGQGSVLCATVLLHFCYLLFQFIYPPFLSCFHCFTLNFYPLLNFLQIFLILHPWYQSLSRASGAALSVYGHLLRLDVAISSLSFREASSDCLSFWFNEVSRSSSFVISFWCVLVVVSFVWAMWVRSSVIYADFVLWAVSNIVCISLNYVLTAVVSSAILSVMISSSTFILVSNPSVVLSRHPVMSWRIASI